MAIEKLSPEMVSEKLQELNQNLSQPWRGENGSIHKVFKFSDFVAAFGFMAQAAIHAEKMNHHPEWCNVYNQVRVHLSTHEADGITERDFQLASKMEDIVS